MALLILLFLRLRRLQVPTPPALFYRVIAATWCLCGVVLGLHLHQPRTSLLYMVGAWCYWLVGFEAAAPGWFRRQLQVLLGTSWHGRFDSLASVALCLALLCHGWARATWCLVYVVASGCRYACRPRPTPAAPAAPRVLTNQVDVWRAGHAAGLLQGFNLGRNATPTRTL